MRDTAVGGFPKSVFSLTYRRSVTRYAAGRIARSKNARWLLRKLPWLPGVPSLIDISTVAFVDGIRVVHPVTINLLRRLQPTLDAHQSVDPAGFRPGYSTTGHHDLESQRHDKVNAWMCARRTTHHDLVSFTPDER